MKTTDPSRYQSYLIRLWRNDPQAIWRASLQSTTTEEIRQFADVEQMWRYLQDQMTAPGTGRSLEDGSADASE